jgi:transcriptional regulator with XRE-family HTH domain
MCLILQAMNDLLWIGPAVHKRRQELGLSQTALARLAGLSRATVNGLERGSLANLSLGRLGQLLQVVGLRLQWEPQRAPSDKALAQAAQMCSVSYTDVLPPSVLAAALASGEQPEAYGAHLITFVDEVPLQVVVGAVEAAAAQGGVPPAKVWKHIGAWARAQQSPRKEWYGL